jgi:hypothetical protein
MEMWVSTHWSDFRNDASLRARLDAFVNAVPLDKDRDRRLRAWVDKMVRADAGLKSSAARARAASVRPPAPLLVEAAVGYLPSALDLHPVEIARQLTLSDESLYKAIEPREATDQAWTKGASRAPNLLRAIERFNFVSEWVSSEIIATDARRGAMIAHFIDVANELRHLGNFQSTMAVLSGLGASAIARLKPLWAELSERHQSVFAELSSLMSLTSNMKNLSEHLLNVTPPAIPYIGLYLGHLTFIDEGNPSKLNGLINFSKRRQVTQTVFQLCRFQILNYEYLELVVVQRYIERVIPINTDDQLRTAGGGVRVRARVCVCV